MSSFHRLSQYSQVSWFPRRPKLPCTLTFDERLRCRVTRQALQHITPFSRPPKIILYKFRCCLFITSPSPRASPSPRVPRPRVSRPASHVPGQARASRKSQLLIHYRITRCVTRCSLREEPLKIWTRYRNSIGNEIWSIYSDKYFEIWTFFS